MAKFKTDPYFINGQHRITILLVGCGGTGSLILSRLARLSKSLNLLEHPGLYVEVVDPDIVEEHNVGRQMFTRYDVGMNKADVLVSKINHAFGFDWDCHTELYDQKKHSNFNVTISAVDNIAARKEILEGFYDSNSHNDVEKPYYLFDCGNARDYGQVILCDHQKKLRNLFDIYGSNLEEQDTVEQQGHGCSYAESLLEQDLWINDWVSLYFSMIFKEMLFEKQLDYQGFVFNTSDFQTQKILIHGKRPEKPKTKRRTRNQPVG